MTVPYYDKADGGGLFLFSLFSLYILILSSRARRTGMSEWTALGF